MQNTRGKIKVRKLVNYNYLSQAEKNKRGYFIVRYATGQSCELKGFEDINYNL